ncbi:LAME_0G04082g1_1 [Lachancea meyersii CBS 8951]|uniref:LAME_0G04082g1_1 n=1 Tax=Lachancea meyersii CBS 8951 TaxID=1266667 RepID=A0A1G4K6S3_9SACH|nr:LAME_0G04082g1_1 [Lachancea meyersii CBS 8951]
MSAPDSFAVVEYALPPFDECPKTYICQCESCQVCQKTRGYVPYLFFAGFIFPMCWILELTIFAYTCFVVEHDIQLPPIMDDELPTLFEVNMPRKCIYKTKNSQDRKSDGAEKLKMENQEDLWANSESSPRPDTARLNQILADAKLEYLDNVKSDVVSWHIKMYKFHRSWALRTAISLLCYIVLICFTVLTLRSSRSVSM